DFGIRGLDLAYALTSGYQEAILVDAMPRGGRPGTLYVLEPQQSAPELPDRGLAVDTHGLSPAKVLRLAAAMGGPIPRVLIVGCEPAREGDGEEMTDSLSAPVRAAVDEAVVLIEAIADRLLRG